MTCGQLWLHILRFCALHLTHPKCTHTAVNTHTVNTHPEQWAAISAAAPGEQLGVLCLAQGHLSRGIEGGERALDIHSLHLQFLPDLRLKPETQVQGKLLCGEFFFTYWNLILNHYVLIMFCHVLIKYTYFYLLTSMLKYLRYKVTLLLADFFI